MARSPRFYQQEHESCFSNFKETNHKSFTHQLMQQKQPSMFFENQNASIIIQMFEFANTEKRKQRVLELANDLIHDYEQRQEEQFEQLLAQVIINSNKTSYIFKLKPTSNNDSEATKFEKLAQQVTKITKNIKYF